MNKYIKNIKTTVSKQNSSNILFGLHGVSEDGSYFIYVSVTGILVLLLPLLLQLLLMMIPSRSFSNPYYVIDIQIDGSAGVCCCYHTHCVLLCCFHVRIIRVWKKNRALKVKVIQRKWNIALRIVQYPILLYRFFMSFFVDIVCFFLLYSLNIN